MGCPAGLSPRHFMKWKLLFLAILIGLVFVGQSWYRSRSVHRFTRDGEFFGSYVKVDVCYQGNQRRVLESVLEDVWNRFEDIHSRLSVYDPNSDINRINQAHDAPITVPEDTYRLIRNSLDYYDISKGTHDITIGPLIKLWKAKGEQGVLPSEDEIAAAKSTVDIHAVALLPGHQIRLTRRDVAINIDSIGDGFAADEAARILRAGGFPNFLVDASGELFASGHSCQGRKWRVGIRDPHDHQRLIDIVELSDLAVSTSGSYERYYEIDGKRWPHIIDPRSGYPAQGIISATVIAPSAEFADFLSTAFCILPVPESLEIIGQWGEDHAAMIIAEDASVKEEKHKSSNYFRFISP